MTLANSLVCSRKTPRVSVRSGHVALATGLLLLLGQAGCSGQAPEHARPSQAKPANTQAPEAEQPAKGTPASPPSAACDQESLQTLQLQPQVSPAGIGLSIINGGSKAVRLASAVALLDARGQSLAAEALRVQRTCSAEPCVTLEPGSELLSPPWLGSSESEHCGSLVRPPSAGSYELALHGCECKDARRVAVQWPTW